MIDNKVPTETEAEAPTTVWWDINRCPVPDDVDARIIGACIRSALNKVGYLGPLTITAIGKLTKVPLHVLLAISSSGISLHHIHRDNGLDLELILWGWKKTLPANVMLISDNRIFGPTLSPLTFQRYNVILSVCPTSSPSYVSDSNHTFLWETLLAMLRAGELELEVGDKYCSENPASFVCSTCDDKFGIKDFQSFITHLHRIEHAREEEDQDFSQAHYDSLPKEDATTVHKMMMMHPKRPTYAEAEAPTKVWWDINRCPVPADVDARVIGRCIKRAVNNLGYMGPLTITAIGILTDVPLDTLRAIYSSGIALHHVPTDSDGIKNVLSPWRSSHRSRANFMLLSSERVFGATLASLESEECNIIRSLFPYDASKVDSSFNLSFTSEGCFFLWHSLLAVLRSEVDELDHKEEMVGSVLLCSTCDELDAKDFESFITHLYSKRHGLEELQFYPQACSSYEKEDATTIQNILSCFRAGLKSCRRVAELELKAELELETAHKRSRKR